LVIERLMYHAGVPHVCKKIFVNVVFLVTDSCYRQQHWINCRKLN